MIASPPENNAMKWYRSLTFKIILCCVVLTFCLIGSIFGVLYHYQQSILTEMEQKSSEIVREIQVGLTTLEVDAISDELLASRFSDLGTRHGVDEVIVYDSEKNVVSSLDSDTGPTLEFGTPEGYITNVPGRRGSGIATRYVQVFPLMVGEKQVGYVDIRLDVTPQTHLVKALQSKILIALLLLFMAALGALCYFMFKLLQPLHTMASTCQEISEGNLHEIDIRPNANEVLILEMKFNEMIRALRTKAEMERRLAQSQRLSALGNLAAGVAHEIGNPLNGIKLTISHLKNISSQHELDETSFKMYADSMLAEVDRLDAIVRDFLTLAKEREPAFQPYDLNTLINETIHLIEKDARKRGLEIATDIQASAGQIHIDPQMLKGAILNIIINAMEASEKKQIIKVSLAESNGQIVLKIADEGCGIPPEIAYRVFDPYFSTKESGTGLGLPITRTIIEKHNGEIAFESGEGKGTTVTVTLPAEEK